MSLPTRPSARTAKGTPASEFIHSLPDKSVTLLIKAFGADLLLRIQAEDTDRHWLIPERKELVYMELEYMTVTVCCNDGLAFRLARKPGVADTLASSRSDL